MSRQKSRQQALVRKQVKRQLQPKDASFHEETRSPRPQSATLDEIERQALRAQIRRDVLREVAAQRPKTTIRGQHARQQRKMARRSMLNTLLGVAVVGVVIFLAFLLFSNHASATPGGPSSSAGSNGDTSQGNYSGGTPSSNGGQACMAGQSCASSVFSAMNDAEFYAFIKNQISAKLHLTSEQIQAALFPGGGQLPGSDAFSNLAHQQGISASDWQSFALYIVQTAANQALKEGKLTQSDYTNQFGDMASRPDKLNTFLTFFYLPPPGQV